MKDSGPDSPMVKETGSEKGRVWEMGLAMAMGLAMGRDWGLRMAGHLR